MELVNNILKSGATHYIAFDRIPRQSPLHKHMHVNRNLDDFPNKGYACADRSCFGLHADQFLVDFGVSGINKRPWLCFYMCRVAGDRCGTFREEHHHANDDEAAAAASSNRDLIVIQFVSSGRCDCEAHGTACYDRKYHTYPARNRPLAVVTCASEACQFGNTSLLHVT